MIVPKVNLPLIGNDQGVAVVFESDWLKAALNRAARKAGYDEWWLLDEFSVAVAHYLRQDYSRKVIELPSLERVVRATLRDIGYDEIAVRFRAVNPFQCLSLADSFTTPGAKQETVFFRCLAERIETLHAAKVQHFHFYDLQLCVALLIEHNPASLQQNALSMRARIVSFVRERAQALAWQRTMLCSIR